MTPSKICFKCGVDKPLTDYYAHKQMYDGHLNKCKECTKKDTKERVNELLKDPEWVEKEQARHRDKYFRLDYKEKHKPTPEYKKEVMTRYTEKYSEKAKARNRISKIPVLFKGAEKHHWSYNEEHYVDIIQLHHKEHKKAHRFIVYDQERFMYRRYDTNELLDTKEKHEAFIRECIETKED